MVGKIVAPDRPTRLAEQHPPSPSPTPVRSGRPSHASGRPGNRTRCYSDSDTTSCRCSNASADRRSSPRAPAAADPARSGFRTAPRADPRSSPGPRCAARLPAVGATCKLAMPPGGTVTITGGMGAPRGLAKTTFGMAPASKARMARWILAFIVVPPRRVRSPFPADPFGGGNPPATRLAGYVPNASKPTPNEKTPHLCRSSRQQARPRGNRKKAIRPGLTDSSNPGCRQHAPLCTPVSRGIGLALTAAPSGRVFVLMGAGAAFAGAPELRRLAPDSHHDIPTKNVAAWVGPP